MAKLLNTASFVTQSAPATPSSGYGTLYASGSSLYFKNSSGTNYNLSIVGSSSIQIYTGSATWTKPAGIQYIKVICGGAGGGAGGGRVGPDGGTRAGGEGGGGGDIAVAYFSSASLTGTNYAINLSGGGAGGLRATAASVNTNGGSGTTPGTSSFSTGSTILLAALGGPRGRGGGITAGTGPIHTAPTTATTPIPEPPFYFCGGDGGQDVGAGNGPGGGGLNGVRYLGGGGSGGRIFAANTTANGGSGSAIYKYNVLTPSGSPGSGNVGGAGSNGAPVVDVLSLLYTSGSNITSSIRIGTGGHGGGSGNSPSPFTVNGGDGGSGSLGAGGGGGGAAGTGLNTIFSGRGGPGGGGFVIIFEYF